MNDDNDLFEQMTSDPDWREHQRRFLQTQEYYELLYEQDQEIINRNDLTLEQKTELAKPIEDKLCLYY